MIFRTYDEEHTWPSCHRAGDGVAEVGFNAAPKNEDGHIRMGISPQSFNEKWGGISVFMSPAEAKKLARDLLVAAGEVEPYYAA